MRPQLTFTLIISAFFIHVACTNTKLISSKIVKNWGNSENMTQVGMKYKTCTNDQLNLQTRIKTNYINNSTNLVFKENGNLFHLNLNPLNTQILKTGLEVYDSLNVSSERQIVDLIFYNRDSNVKHINIRPKLRKGGITITKLNDNTLQMDFKGKGSGIIESNNTFPISGNIKANV